jgi:hypothetical protein
MIVVASWAVYRYLAPSGGGEHGRTLHVPAHEGDASWILGRLYRGGHILLEQRDVGPERWTPGSVEHVTW